MRINLKANNIKNYAQQHLFISIYMLINVLEDPPVGVIEVEVKIPEYVLVILMFFSSSNYSKVIFTFLSKDFTFAFFHMQIFFKGSPVNAKIEKRIRQ